MSMALDVCTHTRKHLDVRMNAVADPDQARKFTRFLAGLRCWLNGQAMGRFLLNEAGEPFSTDDFLACRQLSDGTTFVIVTTRLLVSVAAPSRSERPFVRWVVLRKDVFHIQMYALPFAHCSEPFFGVSVALDLCKGHLYGCNFILLSRMNGHLQA